MYLTELNKLKYDSNATYRERFEFHFSDKLSWVEISKFIFTNG